MSIRNFLAEHKEKLAELFWYAFFGAAGTLVNILIFVVLTKFCSVNYLVSNFLAWIFSVAFAFITNKIWVFKSSSWKFPHWLKECAQFLAARIATLFFDMGYMFAAVSFFHFDETISKIIANAVVIIANYFLSKLWIFHHS